MNKVSKRNKEAIEAERDKLWLDSISAYLPDAHSYDGIDEIIAAFADRFAFNNEKEIEPLYGTRRLNI